MEYYGEISFYINDILQGRYKLKKKDSFYKYNGLLTDIDKMRFFVSKDKLGESLEEIQITGFYKKSFETFDLSQFMGRFPTKNVIQYGCYSSNVTWEVENNGSAGDFKKIQAIGFTSSNCGDNIILVADREVRYGTQMDLGFNHGDKFSFVLTVGYEHNGIFKNFGDGIYYVGKDQQSPISRSIGAHVYPSEVYNDRGGYGLIETRDGPEQTVRVLDNNFRTDQVRHWNSGDIKFDVTFVNENGLYLNGDMFIHIPPWDDVEVLQEEMGFSRYGMLRVRFDTLFPNENWTEERDITTGDIDGTVHFPLGPVNHFYYEGSTEFLNVTTATPFVWKTDYEFQCTAEGFVTMYSGVTGLSGTYTDIFTVDESQFVKSTDDYSMYHLFENNHYGYMGVNDKNGLGDHIRISDVPFFYCKDEFDGIIISCNGAGDVYGFRRIDIEDNHYRWWWGFDASGNLQVQEHWDTGIAWPSGNPFSYKRDFNFTGCANSALTAVSVRRDNSSFIWGTCVYSDRPDYRVISEFYFDTATNTYKFNRDFSFTGVWDVFVHLTYYHLRDKGLVVMIPLCQKNGLQADEVCFIKRQDANNIMKLKSIVHTDRIAGKLTHDGNHFIHIWATAEYDNDNARDDTAINLDIYNITSDAVTLVRSIRSNFTTLADNTYDWISKMAISDDLRLLRVWVNSSVTTHRMLIDFLYDANANKYVPIWSYEETGLAEDTYDPTNGRHLKWVIDNQYTDYSNVYEIFFSHPEVYWTATGLTKISAGNTVRAVTPLKTRDITDRHLKARVNIDLEYKLNKPL